MSVTVCVCRWGLGHREAQDRFLEREKIPRSTPRTNLKKQVPALSRNSRLRLPAEKHISLIFGLIINGIMFSASVIS